MTTIRNDQNSDHTKDDHVKYDMTKDSLFLPLYLADITTHVKYHWNTQAKFLSSLGWSCPFLEDWMFTSEYLYMILASSKHRNIATIYDSIA